MTCACGSGKEYAECCQLYIEGGAPAPSAEALMRSRYTAYTLARIPYLEATLAAEKRPEFNADQARRWATQTNWRGLEIIAVKEQATTATVEFVASYHTGKSAGEHHELASFRKEIADNRWYFVDGYDPKAESGGAAAKPVVTYVRKQPKVGRNEPCPCGSGRKHKQCCGARG